MVGYGLLNLGSLLFGLIAWILPVIMMAQLVKENYRYSVVLPLVSASACAFSLCMQIFYTAHVVKIEDFTALLDTSGAVAMVSALLLVVTIILNSIAMGVYYVKKSGEK